MKILLDTHILIWHLTNNPRLNRIKSEIIEDPSNSIFFSIASLWEIAIKTSIGKLEIVSPVESLVPSGITILNITLADIATIETLPFHHRDPFDRMIIAQTMTHNLTIMTDDKKFKYYDINIV